MFNIEQSGLSDKATSVTVKLDLQDVDASDIDSIVLTNTDGSTQTITVADAIAGIKVRHTCWYSRWRYAKHCDHA
ncbi:hypothetical protein [Psychrobacter sanguinis]|uniref:hypothetical protein n=1 Tax=Psychrobacter sanguinis TaxID=861445 RepID=UPI001D139E8A|nr:hypothetical protein [Psychrobacter sanguinis]UEC25575.1 hypothetical protein LK453_00020 [Psychrobacter sanguinis]